MTVGEHGHVHEHGPGQVHGHVHEDGHVHESGTLAPAAACASVALDIGGGRGALILYPDERFRGLEIEISQVNGSDQRVHTGVHERSNEAQSMLTAIFGSLPAGDYVVWEDAETAGPVVSVPDGGVAELALR